MNHYERVERLVEGMGVTIALAVATAVGAWLKESSFHAVIAFVLQILSGGVAYGFTRWVLYEGFTRARWFRKLLLGRQYVEGWWVIDIYRDGVLEGVALSRFDYLKGGLKWSAERYNLRLEPEGGATGDLIAIEWPMIRYTYQSQRGSGEASQTVGYGERQFRERDRGAPVVFTGFFVDTLQAHQSRTEGRKVLTRQDRLLFDDHAGTKAYLRRHLNRVNTIAAAQQLEESASGSTTDASG